MAEAAEVKDDFDARFEEAAAAAEKEATITPEQKAADVKETEEAAAKVIAAEAAKTPEQVAAETKAAEEAATKAVAEAAKTPEQKAEDVKAAEAAATKAVADAAAKTLADAAAKAAEEVAAKAAAKVAAETALKIKSEETLEQKTSREAFEATIKPYEPTAEEKAALVQFAKDFPNEYAAVEARLKSVDHEINARVYTAVQNVLAQVYGDFSPVVEGFTAESAERHFTALRTANPDHDTVVTKIPDWIKTQPAYLQQAMQAAYDGGTTKDVLDLVATYKTANGLTAAPVKAEEVKSTPTKAAADADALLPVNTKRTNTASKGKPDENDFDGAWAELSAATK